MSAATATRPLLPPLPLALPLLPPLPLPLPFPTTLPLPPRSPASVAAWPVSPTCDVPMSRASAIAVSAAEITDDSPGVAASWRILIRAGVSAGGRAIPGPVAPGFPPSLSALIVAALIVGGTPRIVNATSSGEPPTSAEVLPTRVGPNGLPRSGHYRRDL